MVGGKASSVTHKPGVNCGVGKDRKEWLMDRIACSACVIFLDANHDSRRASLRQTGLIEKADMTEP